MRMARALEAGMLWINSENNRKLALALRRRQAIRDRPRRGRLELRFLHGDQERVCGTRHPQDSRPGTPVRYVMPHFIVEYSDNIASELDIPELLELVNRNRRRHRRLPARWDFAPAPCVTGNTGWPTGIPKNAFVYLDIRVGRGREPEVLRSACQTLFDAVTEFFAADLRFTCLEYRLRCHRARYRVQREEETTSTKNWPVVEDSEAR